jgi:RimJ/RimL family protein N-acetyltransferase
LLHIRYVARYVAGDAMIHMDKTGLFFEIRACATEDIPSLLEMYDEFSPKGKFQGMPPKEKEMRDRWVRGLLKNGENFLAWRDNKVVGHVVVLPDCNKSDAEYLIFAHQSDRGKGIGTALTKTIIKRAKALCIKIIWLTVDAYNFRATRLYKKCGFEFCDTCGSRFERMMSYCYEIKNDS